MHTIESRRRAYEKVKQRRQTWLEQNGPCVKCGSWQDLEVDHIDPSAKVSHRIWSWAEDKRIIELEKCQVLCKIHHMEKTSQENSLRQGGLKHGTARMYRVAKCRCEECLEFRRQTKRLDYAKKKIKAA